MALHKLKIIAGDFAIGNQSQGFQKWLTLKPRGIFSLRERLSIDRVSELKVKRESGFQSVGSAIGGAVVGDILFGGVGAVAGAVIGGRTKKLVTFSCHLYDGRQFIAETDSATFNDIYNGFTASEYKRQQIADKARQMELTPVLPVTPIGQWSMRNKAWGLVALAGVIVMGGLVDGHLAHNLMIMINSAK